MSANTLFNYVQEKKHIKSDAQMSRELGISPPVVSSMRRGKLTAGPSMILGIHETYGVPIKKIRALLGE